MVSRFIPTRVGYTIARKSPAAPGCGSSPLAWGIRFGRDRRWKAETVHPHSRGVYTQSEDGAQLPRRFIPTRVGYTNSEIYTSANCSVHPHSRGVYGKSDFRELRWNTVHPHSRGVYGKGWRNCYICLPVHPHSRGVYGFLMMKLKRELRFIPTRVGYTFKKRRRRCCHGRFIPTRVGYTFRYCSRNSGLLRFIPTRVGYTNDIEPENIVYIGSSPLAWGILNVWRVKLDAFPVHPHSRGVYHLQ